MRAIRSPERGLAISGPLARRIEPLRRKLSDLEAKYETIQQTALGQCRVALVIYHGKDDDRLPPRLRRFLQRPYQTLDTYAYAFLPTGWHKRHVLFSKMPVPLSDALTACADELYVQDARWQGWGLNIFLRHGVDLSPRLDDPATADQFKELFKPKGDAVPIECCLVDAPLKSKPHHGFHSGVAGDRPTGGLNIVGIPKTEPLPQRIRYLNETFVREVQATTRLLPETLKASLEVRGLDVTEHLEELQRTMTAEIDTCVQNTLTQWRQLHEHAGNVFQDVEASHEDVQKIENLLGTLGGTWAAFVERVLDAHLNLSEGKRGAFAALGKDLEEFKQRAQEAHAANAAADKVISQAAAEVQKAVATLTTVENETAAKFQKLRTRHDGYRQARARIAAEIRRLDGDLGQQLTEAAQEESCLADEVAQLDTDLATLKEQQAVIKARRDAVRRQEQAVRATEQQNQCDKAEILKITQQLATQQPAAVQAKQRLHAERADLYQQRQELEQRLQQNLGQARDIDSYRALVARLLGVFRSRPGAFGRRAAAHLFKKVLKLAPEGLFDDERQHE